MAVAAAPHFIDVIEAVDAPLDALPTFTDSNSGKLDASTTTGSGP
jgi:hypothetical protein